MLFGNNKKSQTKIKGGVTSNEASVTILTSGCHFNGKLYCRGSSRIGGRIEGEIISEGLLIIEEEAYITAHIQADETIIQGTVKGRLEAKGKVELSDGSRFDGDIVTPRLIIMEGAKFNGHASMPLNDNDSLVAPILVEEIHRNKSKNSDADKKGPEAEERDKFELTVL